MDLQKIFTADNIEQVCLGKSRNETYSKVESSVQSLGNHLYGKKNFPLDPVLHSAELITILGNNILGLMVLDLGCGSPLNNEYNGTKYPPLVAEAFQKRGAKVEGLDRYPNPDASYDHRVVDIRESNWTEGLELADLVICIDVIDDENSGLYKQPENLKRFLSTIRQMVLSPKGIIFLGNVPLSACKGIIEPDYHKKIGLELIYAPIWNSSIYLTPNNSPL